MDLIDPAWLKSSKKQQPRVFHLTLKLKGWSSLVRPASLRTMRAFAREPLELGTFTRFLTVPCWQVTVG